MARAALAVRALLLGLVVFWPVSAAASIASVNESRLDARTLPAPPSALDDLARREQQRAACGVFCGAPLTTTLDVGVGRWGRGIRTQDPWGNYRFPDERDASRNRYGFTGHYFDSETDLYYAKARYFDPNFGRFLTQDSYLGQIDDPPSLHRYLYGHANPARYVDPTGHCTGEASFTNFSDCFTAGLKGVFAPPANFVLNFGSALLYNATGSERFLARGEAFQAQKGAVDNALRSPAHLLAASVEGFTGQLAAFSEAINEGRGTEAAEILGSGLAQAPLIAETGGVLRMTPSAALATAEGVVIVEGAVVALSPGRLAARGVLMSSNAAGGEGGGQGEAPAAQGSSGPVSASEASTPRKSTSKRLEYMGKTPGKGSRTGREVIDRMKEEGRLLEAQDGSLHVVDDAGKTVPLTSTDMGHLEDAVRYWNREGYRHGPKADPVRQWMRDPKNYELQPSSVNRSRGAQLLDRYRPPEEPK